MIDRDLLITRVIDGEATAEDWSALHALAREDALIWSELASAQQDSAELRCAVGMLSSVAGDIEAPIADCARVHLGVRLRSAATWGGWLAAAAVALSFVLAGPRTQGPIQNTNIAGMIPVSEAKRRVLPELTPDEALRAYLHNGERSGRVVSADPDLLVMSAEPTKDGTFEVVYVRRIVERTRMDLFHVGQDEQGRLMSIPVQSTTDTTRPF